MVRVYLFIVTQTRALLWEALSTCNACHGGMPQNSQFCRDTPCTQSTQNSSRCTAQKYRPKISTIILKGKHSSGICLYIMMHAPRYVVVTIFPAIRRIVIFDALFSLRCEYRNMAPGGYSQSCDFRHGFRDKWWSGQTLRESYTSAIYTHIHIHAYLCADQL